MNTAFILISAFILVTAGIAMSLRNLIHSALMLAGTWFGIAAFYLWAGAEFVALSQVLVYVGAVSMVVLFAVLLTRGSPLPAPASSGRQRLVSAAAALGAAGVIGWGILRTDLLAGPPAEPVGVRRLGEQLAGPQLAAVLVIGVILTVALIGSVILASSEKNKEDSP